MFRKPEYKGYRQHRNFVKDMEVLNDFKGRYETKYHLKIDPYGADAFVFTTSDDIEDATRKEMSRGFNATFTTFQRTSRGELYHRIFVPKQVEGLNPILVLDVLIWTYTIFAVAPSFVIFMYSLLLNLVN